MFGFNSSMPPPGWEYHCNSSIRHLIYRERVYIEDAVFNGKVYDISEFFPERCYVENIRVYEKNRRIGIVMANSSPGHPHMNWTAGHPHMNWTGQLCVGELQGKPIENVAKIPDMMRHMTVHTPEWIEVFERRNSIGDLFGDEEVEG